MTFPENKRLKSASALFFAPGVFLILVACTLSLQPTRDVQAGAPEPTPFAPEPTDWQSSPRLKKPVLPASPSMADKGAIPYWAICLSCHGDKGQGLTDEWREAGFGEDMNCWKSKCHAMNHPTPGFNFPRLVPAIIGAHTLQRFTTVDELEIYIKTTMPWWDPGSLSDQDAWNITAYLLRENGALSSASEINPNNANKNPVHLPIRQQESEMNWQYGIAAVFGLTALSLIAARKIKVLSISSERKKLRPNFFHHLHPTTIPEQQARWRYTLGAGGLALFLSFIVIVTGILEVFVYIPTPEKAGPSIQVITFLIPFGSLVRGLHFWAAQGLVVVSGVHLLRVVFTGAFQPPRRFNYWLGLGLFIIVILLNFTGYILRWDNGIHWALIVGTNLLRTIPIIGDQVYRFVVGGETPGLATLTRFYAWHVYGLFIVSIVLIGWHLFQVRRDGGISSPDPEKQPETKHITRFELARREGLAMLILMSILMIVASLVSAPIAAPIQDASMPLNPDVRAPWFFLWVQQLLRFGNAFWMGLAIPLGMLALLACLPLLVKNSPGKKTGIWFPKSGRIAQIIMTILVFSWLALTLLEINK